MNESTDNRSLIKLLYVLTLAFGLFAIARWEILAGVAVLQLLLWLAAGLRLSNLWRALYRLRWFFVIIVVSYAFLSTGQAERDHWLPLDVGGFGVDVNLGGIIWSGWMCLRVAVLVMASAWLQQSGQAGDLARNLRRLRVPEMIALPVDAALSLLADGRPAGNGKGKGQGDGSGGGKGKRKVSLAKLRQGEYTLKGDVLDPAFARARHYLGERYAHLDDSRLHDLTIILGVVLAVMALKVVQILPGVPIASGHKNLIIVPLFLFAAANTHSRFGGFWAGTAVGIVSFLLGYGKFGVLEITHFALPGLLADIFGPLVVARSRTGRLVQFALVGLILGLGRFTANLLVLILAGAPELAFLLFAPMLLSQLGFGALSCIVSLGAVQTASQARDKQQVETSETASTPSRKPQQGNINE